MIETLIVILVALFCIYLGYQNGILKEFVDFVILIITTLLAGFLSDKFCIYVYKFVPFFNFTGKSEGLKAINIIFWKLILYVLITFILIFIIRRILIKTRLEEKINDSIIEAGFIKKIFGAVVSIPIAFVLLFNIFLILSSPNFNFVSFSDSKITGFIMEKTPLYSSGNKNLYENEMFILNLLKEEEITPDNFEEINENIVNNYIETELIGEDLLSDLSDKMTGERVEKEESTSDDEIDEEEEEDDFSEDEEESDEDESYEEDEEYYEEDEEYYEDEEFYEDEEYYDDMVGEEFTEEEFYEDEEFYEEDEYIYEE